MKKIVRLLVYCPHCNNHKGKRHCIEVDAYLFLDTFWQIQCPECASAVLSGRRKSE
jgi:DNA-directed RNA polymerase subunit RPC12/RpoP